MVGVVKAIKAEAGVAVVPERCNTRAIVVARKCTITMVAAKCTLVPTTITVITTDIGAAAFGFTMTDMVVAAAISRVMNAPIAGAGAVRVSVAASGTTAAKKSAVSRTFNGGSSKGGRRLCEHMKPLARRDAGRCLASLSLSKHLRGVRISVVSRTSPNAAEVMDALASATSTTTLILRRPGSSTVTRYGFKSDPAGLVIVSSEDRTYH
jgi:hypothetical protein